MKISSTLCPIYFRGSKKWCRLIKLILTLWHLLCTVQKHAHQVGFLNCPWGWVCMCERLSICVCQPYWLETGPKCTSPLSKTAGIVSSHPKLHFPPPHQNLLQRPHHISPPKTLLATYQLPVQSSVWHLQSEFQRDGNSLSWNFTLEAVFKNLCFRSVRAPSSCSFVV